MSEDGYGTGGPPQNGCAFSKLRECAICTLRLQGRALLKSNNIPYVKLGSGSNQWLHIHAVVEFDLKFWIVARWFELVLPRLDRLA